MRKNKDPTSKTLKEHVQEARDAALKFVDALDAVPSPIARFRVMQEIFSIDGEEVLERLKRYQRRRRNA